MKPIELLTPVTESDHRSGPDDAPVTLVEYADYECGYCGEAYSVIQELQRAFGDQLRFVFRNFPLADHHPGATLAAEAAESASSRGKFWEMHDALFENQDALSRRDLLRYASKIGDQAEKLRADLDSERFVSRVQADIESGESAGVDQTPTFFINGVMLEEQWSFETLSAAIEEAVSAAAGTERGAA